MNKNKTMKKLILISLVVCLTVNCFSQAPNWIWAKQETSSLIPYRESFFSEIAIDSSGYIYAVGHNNDTTISFGTTTLTHRGMFFVKYDTSGNVIWAKDVSGDGTFNYDAFTITVDVSGNIYIAGHFYGNTVTFGTITLTHQGLFIVKYDNNGNVLWAKDALGNAEVISIKSDIVGNIVVVGGFRGGPLTLGTTTLTNLNNSSYLDDIFIAKYDTSGNVIWAKSAGSADHDVAQSLSIDISGNLFITGEYGGTTIAFDTITLTNTSSSSPGFDMFLAKYNSAGNIIWVKTAIGSRSDQGQTVTVDVNNNIVVAGIFSSPSITFGNITLTKDTTFFYSEAMFVVKYNGNGNIIWAKNTLGKWNDLVSSITTDAAANIYVAGGVSNDTITFSQSVKAFGGLFLAKYNDNGIPLWAEGVGKGSNTIRSVALDALNHIYVAGGFWTDTLIFDSTILLDPNGIVGGPEKVFIAKSDKSISITTSLREIGNQNTAITISPNPFSSQTNIHTNKVFKNATLTVYNLCGQQVEQIKNIFGWTIALYRDNLPSGLYFLRLTENSETLAVDKLIITDK